MTEELGLVPPPLTPPAGAEAKRGPGRPPSGLTPDEKRIAENKRKRDSRIKHHPKKRAAVPIQVTGGTPQAGMLTDVLAATTPATPAGTVTPAITSGTNREKKSKKELVAENERLERQVAGLTAAHGSTLSEEKVAASLAGTLSTLSQIAARLLAVPGVALDPDTECAPLGTAWAPVLSPLMAQHADKAPLAFAVVTTAAVLYRPVTVYLDAQRATPVLPTPDVPAVSQPAGPATIGLG